MPTSMAQYGTIMQHDANNTNRSMDAPLWINKRPQDTKMYKYMQYIRQRYHGARHVESYDELHRWSVANLNDFWSSIVDYCGIRLTPKDTVPLDNPACPIDCIPKWFQGAKMNFAEHLLRLTGPQPAIHFVSERDDAVRTISRDQLRDIVGRLSNALRAVGVQSGDRVAAFCPNVPEVVIFALAAAAIGASYAAASADFGADAVIDRFEQIQPRVLLVGNAAFYNGKVHDQTEKVRAVLERLTCVERCVVINVIDGHALTLDDHEKCVDWKKFIDGHSTNVTFTPLAFDHPLYIMFSSGTTGKPKCIVHGAGGTLIQHMKEHHLHMDFHEHDVFFQFTLTGWMMWQWMVSALAVGVTIVLHDGSPLRPDPLHLWRHISNLNPKYLHTLKDYLDGQSISQHNVDLSHLRVITSTGSVLPPDLFKFAYEYIKRDMMLASITGGTDIISLFAGGCPIKPVYAGELQCVCLGMQVEAWTEQGTPMMDAPGDLVCTRPFPCQPIFFLNDPNHDMYRKAYFSRFPGCWHHGDYCSVNSLTGGLVMLGRSDGTLNPMGVRFGSSELYNLMAAFPQIEDTLAISYKRVQDTDERLVLFIKMRRGDLNEALVKDVKSQIRQHLSPRHVPSFILQCPDIPYTTNGKKVEVAVKRILSQLGDCAHGNLVNPECMQYYVDLSKKPLLYQ